MEVERSELRYFKEGKQSEGLVMAGTLNFNLYLCEVKTIAKEP